MGTDDARSKSQEIKEHPWGMTCKLKLKWPGRERDICFVIFSTEVKDYVISLMRCNLSNGRDAFILNELSAMLGNSRCLDWHNEEKMARVGLLTL